MQIVFISPDFYENTIHIMNVLDRSYQVNLEWSKNIVNALKHPYIIVKIEKEPKCMSAFLKDLEYLKNIRIVETANNYYLSIPMNVIIKLIYENKNSVFGLSEKLRSKLTKFIPNVLDKEEYIKWVKGNISKDILERVVQYINIISDMRHLNREYLYILDRNSDLTRDDLNKLFRITTRMLLPIHKILKLARLDEIILDYNDYATSFDKLLNDRIHLSHKIDSLVTSFLSRISINDPYTNSNAPYSFVTTETKIASFIYENLKAYPGLKDILPVSTLVDAFITTDLETLKQLSNKYTEFSDIFDLLCYKNNIMSFALKNIEPMT